MNKNLLFTTIVIISSIPYNSTAAEGPVGPPIELLLQHMPRVDQEHMPRVDREQMPRFNGFRFNWRDGLQQPMNCYYMLNALLCAHQIHDIQQKNGTFAEKRKYIGQKIIIDGSIHIGTNLIINAVNGIVTIIKDTYTNYKNRNQIEPLKKTVSILKTELNKIIDERNQLRIILQDIIEQEPNLLQKLMEKKNKNRSPASPILTTATQGSPPNATENTK